MKYNTHWYNNTTRANEKSNINKKVSDKEIEKEKQ